MRLLLVAGLISWSLGAQAEPARLATPFGEGMVLQRDRALPLWGVGEPGERIELQLGRSRAIAQVGADGRWRVRLPPQRAAGPLRLLLRDGQGITRVQWRDVWLGDVWLLGGQSNMEWSVAQSQSAAQVLQTDAPRIRHLRVPLHASYRPLAEPAAAQWTASRPGAAAAFSAVGWHFAHRVQQRHPKVAIGLVNLAWGGSMLETWLSRAAAAADPQLAPPLATQGEDAETHRAALRARLTQRVAAFQGDAPLEVLTAPQAADPALDDRHWPTLDVPGVWESQGLNELDGTVWLRREFVLSPEQAAGAATLHLGPVDDCDDTWLNGQRLGGLCQWDALRVHAVPAGLLREGRNVLAVRVTDHTGGGGVHGAPERLRLETAAGTLPLAGAWRARVVEVALPATTTANDGIALAHNAMVEPLRGLAVKGVLWYQGESNVGRAAAYAAHFQTLIADWRAHFGQPQLPFYFVQLASFLPLAQNDPNNAPWAELRDAQAQALRLPHTGMAVTLDVGDPDDIHPRAKRSVGERLARWALAQSAQGPRLRRLTREGASLLLTFDRPLRLRVGERPQGFALAQAGGRFVPAQAEQVAPSRVRLRAHALTTPAEVRYGWVNNPSEANLVGAEGLPVAPFRSDARPLVTAGARYAR